MFFEYGNSGNNKSILSDQIMILEGAQQTSNDIIAEDGRWKVL